MPFDSHRPVPSVPPVVPALSGRAADPWRSGEPTLSEVMADPIVHLLMRRDGLTPGDVWPVLADARHALARGVCGLMARAA